MARSKERDSVLSWLTPRLFVGSVADVVSQMLQKTLDSNASSGKISLIFTPNPEQVELAERNPTFAAALQSGEFLLPDGNGLVWAAERAGVKLERVTGREVLAEWLAQPWESLPRTLLLGGSLETAQVLAHQIDHSGQKIQGFEGFANIAKPTPEEEKDFWNFVEAWKPKMIFVGFGAPKQELWAVENQEKLARAGVRVVMVVGGAFEVLSGRLAAPPNWMVQTKLEWFFRLWQEPSRWQRQIWLIRFVWRVVFGR